MDEGRTDDGYKVGLALEGGGMRGVVSGAMLLALRRVGADTAIDCYCGTSSGSINLSYFLTGASWDALAVYYDHLIGDEFFNARRALRRKAPLSLDYLFDQVMAEEVPLDYARVATLPEGLLNVAVTDVDRVEPLIKSSFASEEEVYHLLKAGAWLPLLAGGPYQWNGHRYLDSGVLYPDPVLAAIDVGCTHVLVCNTDPQALITGHADSQRRLLQTVLNRTQPGLGDEYFRRRRDWRDTQRLLGYGETMVGGTHVFRLAAAADAHAVQRLTRDRGLLFSGARAGFVAVLDAFGMHHEHVRFALTEVGPPPAHELARLRHE